jgi:hypothetical protein
LRVLLTVKPKEQPVRAWLCLLPVSLLCSAASGTAAAGPWLEPGDLALRHDLTVLADAGVLRAPITTWPVSWADVLRAVSGDPARALEPAEDAALQRVRRAARVAARRGFDGVGYEIAGAERPTLLRDFSDTPREQGTVAAGGSWLGERFAAGLRVTAVADPVDGRTVRLDGSYLGVTLGNVKVSAGTLERWWGPGWDGSLILSSNARPMPQLTLERNYAEASRLPVLKWFGPWRATVSMAQAEDREVAVPGVRFFAARVNFKPRPWLELGLSRTAQWCGEGRPCDLDAFLDLLVGRDNPGDSQTAAAEPGNQMAGYDFRLRSPWAAAPVALYGQFIGEDEAGGLPAKFIEQLGLETWGGTPGGSAWRVRVEYTDTTCVPPTGDPLRDCAGYRSNPYPQGYAYRGRIIGHSLDNDGRAWSLGALLLRPSGSSLAAVVRRVELNRDGLPSDPQHATSPAGASELTNYEVQWNAARLGGRVSLGVGYDDVAAGAPAGGSGLRGFLRYRRGI